MTTNEDDFSVTGDLQPLTSSITTVKIGNREYSMVKSRRCAVCMHPGRFAIEEKMLLNFGYPAIAKFISEQEINNDDGTTETWPMLTAIQLRHHREVGHLGLTADMVHEIAKRRAEAEGIDLENNVGAYVDHFVANKMIQGRAIELLVRGEIQPDVKDLIAVNKMMADLEKNQEANADVQQYQELIRLFWETTRQIVGDDAFKKIVGKLENHPLVTQFRQHQERRELQS